MPYQPYRRVMDFLAAGPARQEGASLVRADGTRLRTNNRILHGMVRSGWMVERAGWMYLSNPGTVRDRLVQACRDRGLVVTIPNGRPWTWSWSTTRSLTGQVVQALYDRMKKEQVWVDPLYLLANEADEEAGRYDWSFQQAIAFRRVLEDERKEGKPACRLRLLLLP